MKIVVNFYKIGIFTLIEYASIDKVYYEFNVKYNYIFVNILINYDTFKNRK